MTKKIGKIRKQFLTRERLYLIVEYLNRPSAVKNWTNCMVQQWKEFLGNLDENIMRLYYELRYQVWNPKPFIIFKRVENGKVRIIYASFPIEQIVDNLYTDCLNYVFLEKKRIVPANCYGSIKGKGQHELRSLIIKRVKHRTDLFVGVSDTSKYYPTMDHWIMFNTLCHHIKDKWLLWLSRININRMGDIGMALGLPSSNPLGHVYHAFLDWYILLTCKVRRYYRFCDDKFVIHKDVNYLHTIMRTIRDGVEKMNQHIKKNWRVINCTNERFECLGALINSHNARLRPSSRRRVEHMMSVRIKEDDPIKAYRSWSGVLGSLKGLDVSNLINYWHRRFEEFFELIHYAKEMLYYNRKQKKWHNKLHTILTCAPDMRSEQYKKIYAYGPYYTEAA